MDKKPTSNVEGRDVYKRQEYILCDCSFKLCDHVCLYNKELFTFSRVFDELKNKNKTAGSNRVSVVNGKVSNKVNNETCDEITVVPRSDEKSDVEVVEVRSSRNANADSSVIVDVCAEDCIIDDSFALHEPRLSPEQLATICIKLTDFEEAFKCVQPSAKREGFATVPDVTWNDIGLSLIHI